MEQQSIREALENIISKFALESVTESNNKELSANDKLLIILSESSQALELVTTIEDEFNIGLEDDDIDLDFFVDFEMMLARIEKAISQKKFA